MMISNVSNPIEIPRFARVSPRSSTQIRLRAQFSSGYRPRWLATRTGFRFKEISTRHSSYGGGGFRARCASETSPSTSSTAEEGGGQEEESEGDAEAMKLFEEIRNAERKRVEKQEEFEQKANLQLERQIMMASNWSRALLKLRGKLKGTEWDPENSHKIDYSDFLRLLDSNSVQYMEYSDFGQKVSVILPYYKEEEAKGKKSRTSLKKEIVYKRHIIERMPVDCWNDVWKKLHQQLVNVDVINVDPVPVEIYSTISIAVVWAMRFALAVGFYLWIDSVMRPIYLKVLPLIEREKPLKKKKKEKKEKKVVSRRGKSEEGSMGKSRAKFISAEETTGVTFDDFAGQEYIKQDLKEIVHILKNEEMYKAKGLYCPKGVLLYGPPGTGKTLLARAIAGEAGLPFFATNGTDFVEMFAGVAASRVKDLFANARSNAPAIVFIDEIDAIGCRRGGADAGGGAVEREQGLLQLLTEMDGFKVSTEQVLVIGATNRVDILDPALVRKGRFDRIVRVGLPTKEGRLAILKVHARDKSFRSEEEKDALLEEIAAKTDDFSGAELQNILNEAGILTARKDEDYIRREELMEALTRQDGTFETGQEDVVEVPEDLRVRLAYREAAVAVLSCYYPDSNHRFTWTHIMYMDNEPNAEYTKHRGEIFLNKSDYVRSIVRSCAPRVIEELIFGLDKLSWTAAPSPSKAAKLAEVLILRTGMTAFGLPYYRNYGDFVTNLVPKYEALREEYVRFGVDKCTSVLQEYHEAVESIADVLLEEGGIGAKKVLEIYNSSPRAPQPPVAPADEYGALMYAGRWGIYGVSLPGRVTFAPGNMGFATFGAPRPVKVAVMRPVFEYFDDISKNAVEIKDEVADTEQPVILMASHFL